MIFNSAVKDQKRIICIPGLLRKDCKPERHESGLKNKLTSEIPMIRITSLLLNSKVWIFWRFFGPQYWGEGSLF